MIQTVSSPLCSGTEFQLLLRRQNGLCAICKRDLEETTPCVDHCHTEGHVRGLLCRPCNAGLGMFKDNERFLLNAVHYLQEDKYRKSDS